MSASFAAVGEQAAAAPDWQPRIVALVCNWCSYAGADMAGTTRLAYPANIRLVRFPCTGRMSPLVIVRAFEQGADGVLVSGCHPGDCHYVHGNLVARRRFSIFRSLLEFVGVDRRRLHLAWVSAAEGAKWAHVVEEVTTAVRQAGPLPSFAVPSDGEPARLPPPPEASVSTEREQVTAVRDHLRETATELLASERVGLLVGYGPGSLEGRQAALFCTAPDEAAGLEWGEGCLGNLAVYLPQALARSERVALVVKRCDVGAVTSLIRERQVPRERLLLIGAACAGVRDRGEQAVKCGACSGDCHPMCDLGVTAAGALEQATEAIGDGATDLDSRAEQVAYLDSLRAEERWRFWQRQFSRCLRCYACRAACPLCYCTVCIARKHRPQWVSPVIDASGNTAWNIVRAFHLAGRCGGCDECARVCPAGVRLDLLNRKLALESERLFGNAQPTLEEPPLFAGFGMDDLEESFL